MEVKVIRHALGDKQEKHKYIARVELPKRPGMKFNNYRYFYDRPSYNAYLKTQNTNAERTPMNLKGFNNVINNLFSKKTTISGVKAVELGSKTVSEITQRVVASGKKEIKEAVKEVEKKVDKVTAEIEKPVKTSSDKEKIKDKAKEIVTKIDAKTDLAKEKVKDKTKEVAVKVNNTVDITKEKIEQFSDNGKQVVSDYLNENEQTEIGALGDYVRTIDEFVATVLVNGIGTALFNLLGTIASDLIDEKEERDREEEQDEERDREEEWEEWERERLKELEEWEKERKEQELRQETEILDEFSDLQTKDREYTNDEDQEETNPYYYTGEFAYTNNCAYCTAAYDLRQRGYDVEAAAISENHCNTADEILSWYDDAELVTLRDVVRSQGDTSSSITTKQASEYLEADMLSHGEGARGHLLLYWSDGGGHDVIWEVENGEVVMRDCQTNDTLEVHDYVQYCSDVSYFRSDNLEPNEKILKTVRNK